jgi:hypothetical protein
MDTPIQTLPPFIPRKPIKYKPRVPAPVVVAPPPQALVLVAASFDPDGPEVYLTFDRAIDIAGLIVGAFAVADGPDGHRLVGFESPFLIAPNQVQVLMHTVDSASGPDVLLSVEAANGIVAADDGGTWAGVSELSLPFE